MSEDTVKIGDENVNLADIAGVDMADVKEFRFENTAKGIYQFKVLDSGLKKLGEKAAAVFQLEITNCFAVTDDTKQPEDMIGVKHQEAIFITDAEKDLGRIKAFMVDSGLTGSGTLTELMDQFVGTEFVAPVVQRKDKNDTDKVYSNLDYNKIKTLADYEEAAA